MSDYAIVTGSAHPKFAEKVATILDMELCPVSLRPFSDGEIGIQIKQSVRGKHVLILQPTCSPTNDNLMEILLITDALKRSSARLITAVIPYFGYSRQDRKAAPRVPISSKLVADLLEVAGVNRVVTMDLHSAQIQGFFNVPVDNIYGLIIFTEYFKSLHIDKSKTLVASPDVGGVTRARAFAKKIDADIAIVDKRREKANESEVMNIIGDPMGKDVFIIDDMIDTAGTITKAAKAFKDKGALSVRAFCTHAVLSGKACQRIEESELDELIVTDTIPLGEKASMSKLTVLSAADLFAIVVRRITNNQSVDSLFD